MFTRTICSLSLAVIALLSIIAPVYASAPATSVVGPERQVSHGIWLPLMLILALALISMPAIMPKSFKRWRK